MHTVTIFCYSFTTPKPFKLPVICYELPLNERIRMLLRLESLFNKIDFFSAQAGAFEHHAALVALFEILDVTSRLILNLIYYKNWINNAPCWKT